MIESMNQISEIKKDIQKSKERLLHLEVMLGIRDPPQGWITSDKVRLIRDRDRSSMLEAKRYLIKSGGRV